MVLRVFLALSAVLAFGAALLAAWGLSIEPLPSAPADVVCLGRFALGFMALVWTGIGLIAVHHAVGGD